MPELAQITGEMADALEHRGPDGRGVWSDETQRLVLGHRRLSIVDLSETGRQPMRSADRRWIIIFNGEIYNHRSIREELDRIGCQFKGTSDTEVLTEGIARWGVEATLKRCRGMLALAAWDTRNCELTLARDRIGEKPLYVAMINGALAFASELKAFFRIPGWNPSINNDALWDYLNFGYVCGDKAIYRSVGKVPPGSYLTLNIKAIQGNSTERLLQAAKPFWKLTADPDLIECSDQEATTYFESLFEQAIGEQLVADVPVGAFLSGGLDSSLVVALAAKVSSHPVQTFTIGFSDDSYDESPWAKTIATHLGTDHHELHLTEQDLLNTLPIMASIYDEPFADPSQVPTFLISKFARQSVKVALTGDGGDELFCGYNRYIQFRKASRFADTMSPCIRRATGRMLQSIPVLGIDQSINLGRRLSGTDTPLQSPGGRLHKLGQMIQADSLGERYRALLRTSAPDALMISAITEARAEISITTSPSEIEGYLMRCDLKGYLPDNGLVKLDRASMANSLESRAPFLDPRIVENAFRLPLQQKLRNNRGKWILRSILSRHIPSPLFERPKAGFSVPVAAWLRGPLAGWLGDVLSTDQIKRRGLLDPSIVSRIIAQHKEGQVDHARLLWAIIMLESWLP